MGSDTSVLGPMFLKPTAIGDCCFPGVLINALAGYSIKPRKYRPMVQHPCITSTRYPIDFCQLGKNMGTSGQCFESGQVKSLKNRLLSGKFEENGAN